jgi:hypothetical protein
MVFVQTLALIAAHSGQHSQDALKAVPTTENQIKETRLALHITIW